MLGIIGDIARALLPVPDRHTASGRRARSREIRSADAAAARVMTPLSSSARDRYPTFRG